jgi:hypothetical protein
VVAIAENLELGSGNLGHVVEVLRYAMAVGEWKPLNKALESIATFQTPRNKSQVKHFLKKKGNHRI